MVSSFIHGKRHFGQEGIENAILFKNIHLLKFSLSFPPSIFPFPFLSAIKHKTVILDSVYGIRSPCLSLYSGDDCDQYMQKTQNKTENSTTFKIRNSGKFSLKTWHLRENKSKEARFEIL